MRRLRRNPGFRRFLPVLLCCALLTGAAAAAGAAFRGSRPEPAVTHYSGENGSFRVDFTRYAEYKDFKKALPAQVVFYNTEMELSRSSGTGYLAGALTFDRAVSMKECAVELVRADGRSVSTVAVNPEPEKEGPLTIAFYTLDKSDTVKNRYQKAVVRFGTAEGEIDLRAE